MMQGNLDDAIRRFNQAWLLDRNNGVAIWGMGAVESNKARHREAVALLTEAATSIGRNYRFQLDCARAIGMAGTESKDPKLIELALVKFETIYSEHPTGAISLQNWAMTLYALERYPEAWEKIRIAQTTPEAGLLSQAFIQDLTRKVGTPK